MGKKTNQFSQVRRTVLSEEIARQIKEAILSGVYEPGEQLPSEREFAEMFDVGRPTIREAIKTLRGRGLVELDRSVQGHVVTTPDLGLFIKPIREQLAWSILINEDTVKDIWEVIPRILGLLAHSIIDRDKAGDCSGLERQLQLMEARAEKYFEIALESYRFGKVMGEMSGNPLSSMLWAVLKDIITRELPHVLDKADPEGPGNVIKFHRNLLKAIQARDHALVYKAVAARREYLLNTPGTGG